MIMKQAYDIVDFYLFLLYVSYFS